MRHAVKKKKIVHAYRLGDGSPMECLLLREGAIARLPDGRYELFSQESVNGHGQVAAAGDYFKVDVVNGRNYPYPNDRAYFEQHHTHISGDIYEQISQPIAIWQVGDEACEEIRYLMDSGNLHLNEEDSGHYFNAVLWGAPLSAPRDAVIALYSVERDDSGSIQEISFNFIQRDYFNENYEWV